MTLQDAAGVKKLPSGHWLSLIALLLPGVASAAALSQRGAALLLPVPSACAGEAVRAAAPGKVMRIQRKGPGGLEVLVQHDGFVGIYSHLGMVTPSLAEGKSTLAAGEKLGVVGHSGLTYGMHLYFEMLLSGRPVDPAPYLGLPLCNGAYRTRADMVASDGKIPPTRRDQDQ
jgi:hypothetical protein